ncbi:MAG: SDR family oxidoreductase [Rectinemataceae bacterium]|nr:SDR family oxidoreductase [Rectinemataceae bacterium]
MGLRKRVLVTGGAGFIGSHLCEELLRQRHEVICLDNFYSGRMENVEHLRRMSPDSFTLITANVNNPLFSQKELFGTNIDWIFNLACPASPQAYQRDPVETIRTNVLGTMNVLDFAGMKGARVLQASTSEVYGDPLVHPQSESYWGNVNPLSPRGCYDEGKRCAETLCFDYRQERNVDAKIVRIFNTYGPRMAEDDGRVVSNFIVQALQGKDITIYGDGSQTRSFQYIDDLVQGMLMVMVCHQGEWGPFNLGNPGEFTIQELAELVLELTGSESKIVHRPLPECDPKQRCPDITRAEEALHWKPVVSLAEGLEKTIEYFKAILTQI